MGLSKLSEDYQNNLGAELLQYLEISEVFIWVFNTTPLLGCDYNVLHPTSGKAGIGSESWKLLKLFFLAKQLFTNFLFCSPLSCNPSCVDSILHVLHSFNAGDQMFVTKFHDKFRPRF